MTNINNELVTVIFHGLALSCFSEKAVESEKGKNTTAILRQGEHKLKIKIKEIAGGVEKTYLNTGKLPKKNVEIKIKATKNPQIGGFKKFLSSPDFNRADDTQNKNDFRWMPDIEGSEFHQKQLDKIKQKSIKLSKMTIQNAEFYCEQISDVPPIVRRNNLLAGKLDDVDFGKVGFKMGAKIPADEVCLEIKINGKSKKYYFKAGSGKKYKICIENLTPGEDHIPDFECYYKILSDSTDTQFELDEIVILTTSPSTGVGRERFCGMVMLGETTSIENLF